MTFAPAANADPVSFLLSPLSFNPDAGYGVDGNEIGGTLLDVDFAAAVGATAFSLAAVGDSFDLVFGTITLLEGGNVNADETDGLGVTATFGFVDPFLGLRQIMATGTAFTGLVGGPGIDFTIAWSPVVVAFGNGGLFEIAMDSLNFRSSGQALEQTATITLLAVPEPATLALVSLALAGTALGVRRRRAAT